MRIALVNPQVEAFSGINPPLGLFYVAAILEKSHEVKIFDPFPHEDDYVERIKAFDPDVIGVTLLTSYFSRAKKIMDDLRNNIPKALYIAGGVHATALPEETMKKLGIDICIIGEGELTTPEVLTCYENAGDWSQVKGITYYDKDGHIQRTMPRELIEDLDSIPYPARHLTDFERYLLPPGMIRGWWSERATTMLTSRGCPKMCIWCGSQSIFGRKVRRRSIQNVMGEIELLINTWKIDTIYFHDDTFTLNKKWVYEFCDELQLRNYNIKWACQARVDTVTEDLLERMKKSGCIQVDYGVESGSPKVLKALKKNISPETVKKTFAITKKVGIRTLGTFMVGNPEELDEDVQMTMKLCREIKPSFASMFFLTPFPGTELMDLAKSNGWLRNYSYELNIKGRCVMEINFTAQRLLRYRRRFQRQVLWQNWSSLLFNFNYIFKAFLLVKKYPMGIFAGLKKFVQTWVFDDFIFEFLIYYTGHRKRGGY